MAGGLGRQVSLRIPQYQLRQELTVCLWSPGNATSYFLVDPSVRAAKGSVFYQLIEPERDAWTQPRKAAPGRSVE